MCLQQALVDEGARDERFGLALRELELGVLKVEHALAERLSFLNEVDGETDGALDLAPPPPGRC